MSWWDDVRVIGHAAAESAQDHWHDARQGVADRWHGLQQEGVRQSLRDTTGVLDRQAAQRELAGQFVVGPHGHDATMPGNHVTAAEFRHVAEMYSDVRLGRGGLQFADSAEGRDTRYRGDTMRELGRILQTETGRDLVGDLQHQRDNLTVTYLAGHASAPDTRRMVSAERRPDGSRGTGSDASITNGHLFERHLPGSEADRDLPGLRSDVALYHELVHAGHAVHGDTRGWDLNRADFARVDGSARQAAGDPTDYSVVSREVEGLPPGRGAEELSASGLGSRGLGHDYFDPRFNENRYRRERNRIGQDGRGAVTGSQSDRDLPQRRRYTYGSV